LIVIDLKKGTEVADSGGKNLRNGAFKGAWNQRFYLGDVKIFIGGDYSSDIFYKRCMDNLCHRLQTRLGAKFEKIIIKLSLTKRFM
jgi:hypothetical protein